MILVVALVIGGDAGPSTSCWEQQPGLLERSGSCPCSPGSAGATPLPSHPRLQPSPPCYR